MNYKKHIFFWSIFILCKVILDYFFGGINADYLDVTLTNIIHLFVFYSVYYVLSFLNRKIYFLLFLPFIYGIYYSLIFFYCKYFIQFLGHGEYYSEVSAKSLVGYSISFYFEFVFYAFGYYFLQRNTFNEKEARAKEKENLLLQSEKLQLELEKEQLSNQKIEADYNFLRTQINPHFLYNTLGFFYGKVAPHDEEAAEGILKLTNIMRYSLHEGDELGRVPLEMEIENLENYLDLQQMRFGKQLQLQYHKEVSHIEDYKILPHLMLTLVENAFKHGNNSKPEHPLVIELHFEGTQLSFTVINCINMAKHNTVSTSKGLANMKGRLALVYKTNQQFATKVEEPLYIASMQIDLSNPQDKVNSSDATDKETYLNEEPGKSSGGLSIAALL
jgi:two-component system, LytTR family, sensor kinase